MINAGDLKKRITFQRRREPPDTERALDGSEILEWQDTFTVWAEYLIKSGREFYAAQKVNAEINAAFKLWYRHDIDPTMRVRAGNRYYDILFVNDEKKFEGEMVLGCREVV